MKITFHGAAETVTGSKHLITTPQNKQLLLDCGLFQGMGPETDDLNSHFGFDPGLVDYLVLSHAHTDHAGLIPRLVREGFKGPVYCTEPTLELCKVMLADSAHIQEYDVKYVNKRLAKRGAKLIHPLYTTEDVIEALKQFEIVPLNTWKDIDEHIRLLFTDAGHILGSAAVNLEFKSPEGTIRLFYSGDVGRYSDVILREPQPFPQCDYMICESTYGDRLHETAEDAEQRLLDIVLNTCSARKGKLIIPAFSLGRTQEIVYTLDRLNTQGKLPQIPVYVDSPLAISATSIMRKYTESFNPEIKEYMKFDPDPFGFPNVHYIRDAESSKALNSSNEPCIIISASGMMDAGRIRHHIKNNIEDPKNTVLIVGYVSPNSLGGHLIARVESVKLFGDEYKVRADVQVIDSYSAHADYSELLRYLKCQDPQKVKQVFLVHGETEAQEAFKIMLKKEGYDQVIIPQQGESFEIKKV